MSEPWVLDSSRFEYSESPKEDGSYLRIFKASRSALGFPRTREYTPPKLLRDFDLRSQVTGKLLRFTFIQEQREYKNYNITWIYESVTDDFGLKKIYVIIEDDDGL